MMFKRPSSRFLGLLHAQARSRGDAGTMRAIENESIRLGCLRETLAHAKGVPDPKRRLETVFAAVFDPPLRHYAPTGVPVLWAAPEGAATESRADR